MSEQQAVKHRSLVVSADGSVMVDGETIAGADPYTAAIARFAQDAAAEGGDVLVRSEDASAGGEVSWFRVDGAGHLTVADAPSEEPAPAPLRRRQPTAADFAASRTPMPDRPAAEGWRGALNTLSGGLLRLAPSEHELSLREWRQSVQRGLAGHKTVAFVNLKGGASKTTSCYLVASTFGRERGGNILAWDNNENKGTLGDRAIPASHDHTAVDLLEHAERFTSTANAHELVNYMRPQGANKFHVLASQNQASNREVIDGDAFVQLHGVARQFYHLLLVDTGNASTASTWQAAVELADGLVITAMNKEDSLKTAAATVDTLVEQGFGPKLARGVLMVTQPAIPSQNRHAVLAEHAARLERAREHFGAYVREVVEIPFDVSLDGGGEIVYEQLAPATREAYLRATAAIVEGL